MGKRGNELSGLSKDDYYKALEKEDSNDNDTNTGGGFAKASADVLKQRKIISARRRFPRPVAPPTDATNTLATGGAAPATNKTTNPFAAVQLVPTAGSGGVGTSSKKPFSFGASSKPFSFAASPAPVPTPKQPSSFVAVPAYPAAFSQPFLFDAAPAPAAATTSTSNNTKPFSFAAAPDPTAATKPFSFGASSTPAPAPAATTSTSKFSFAASSAPAPAAAAKPFSFGAASTPAPAPAKPQKTNTQASTAHKNKGSASLEDQVDQWTQETCETVTSTYKENPYSYSYHALLNDHLNKVQVLSNQSQLEKIPQETTTTTTSPPAPKAVAAAPPPTVPKASPMVATTKPKAPKDVAAKTEAPTKTPSAPKAAPAPTTTVSGEVYRVVAKLYRTSGGKEPPKRLQGGEGKDWLVIRRSDDKGSLRMAAPATGKTLLNVEITELIQATLIPKKNSKRPTARITITTLEHADDKTPTTFVISVAPEDVLACFTHLQSFHPTENGKAVDKLKEELSSFGIDSRDTCEG